MSGERRFENGRWWQWDGERWLLEPEAPARDEEAPARDEEAPASASTGSASDGAKADHSSWSKWDGDTTDPEYQAALTDARKAQAAKDDTRRGMKAIAVFLVLAVLGVVWVSSSRSNSTPSRPSPTQVAKSSVTYKVTGSARTASITVQTPTGTSQQETDVPMMNKGGTAGLTYSFDEGEFVYISAQNGQDSGTIECSIEVNGIVIAKNSASGGYSIAQCDGRS